MRYLITGGSGFIGSHLTEALLMAGNHVTILDDFSTGRFENISHLDGHPSLTIINGDVKDAALVEECVKEVDQVYHLASAVGVQLVVDRPVHTINTIVHGTNSILDACSKYRRPVLITSTSEVYGKATKTPFNEDDDSVTGPPTRQRWSYACAKALDEFLALAHWHQSRVPVVLVRLFNTVGPRQTGQYGMVIPSLIQQALADAPITVFGDGKQARCFCHVKDVVWALTRLLGPPETRGELYNVGSTQEIQIIELAEKIREYTNSNSEIVFVPYAEAYGEGFEDMQRRVPDLQKVKRAVSFSPRQTLDDIIRDCVEHVRAKAVEVVH